MQLAGKLFAERRGTPFCFGEGVFVFEKRHVGVEFVVIFGVSPWSEFESHGMLYGLGLCSLSHDSCRSRGGCQHIESKCTFGRYGNLDRSVLIFVVQKVVESFCIIP